MSARHVRRHQRSTDLVDELALRRSNSTTELVALRAHLASVAAAFDAHQLDGATSAADRVVDVERILRSTAPGVYDRDWPSWATQDAALAHTADESRSGCPLCAVLDHRDRPTAMLAA